jgi:TctA family transporter
MESQSYRICRLFFRNLYRVLEVFRYHFTKNAPDIFGLVGYFMEKADIPSAPLILAVIVGNSMEQSFRQALTLARLLNDILYDFLHEY